MFQIGSKNYPVGFVDMAEMLPEYWSGAKSEEEHQKQALPRRSHQGTDIFTWIHCYALYVSVLAGHFTESVPELIVHPLLFSTMITVMQISHNDC